MKRISKKLMKSQRGASRELGASLTEYVLIVSLISMIAILAIPGATNGIHKAMCNTVVGLNSTAEIYWDQTGQANHRCIGRDQWGQMAPIW